MAWWQIGLLAALVLSLAWAAAVLRGSGRIMLFVLVAALAGALTWVTVGLMLGGIAPGRTKLMLPASSGVVPAQNEALRQERRLYAMLAERHPETAPRIADIEKLRSAGDEKGLRPLRLALLGDYLPFHAARASDDSIRAFAQVAIENLELILARDPLLCRETAASRHSMVDDALSERAASALIAVLGSALEAPQPPPDAAEAIRLRRSVIDALYASGDETLVARPLLGRSAQTPPAPYCRTFIRVFKGILALPPEESGKVLRFHYG